MISAGLFFGAADRIAMREGGTLALVAHGGRFVATLDTPRSLISGTDDTAGGACLSVLRQWIAKRPDVARAAGGAR
jgi:hypothetical protein